MANSVLEDEILEALTKIDNAQIALKKLQDEVAAAKRQLESAGLRAEVLTIRAHPDAEAATVVRLTARR